MSAMYAMRYGGQAGTGLGVVYVGRGTIVGIDAVNGRYRGTYSEQNGRLKGAVSLSIPGGGTLVTGQPLGNGQSLSFSLDWPQDFGNGSPQQLTVGGGAVTVTFEKIGDIP